MANANYTNDIKKKLTTVDQNRKMGNLLMGKIPTTTEEWDFELEDDSTIRKTVIVLSSVVLNSTTV